MIKAIVYGYRESAKAILYDCRERACPTAGDTIYTDDDIEVVPHMCDAMDHTGVLYEGPVLGLYSSTCLLKFSV